MVALCFDHTDISFTDTEKFAVAPNEINQSLQANGKSLDDYPSLPRYATQTPIDLGNQFILQELNFNKDTLKKESEHLLKSLIAEEKNIFDMI